MSNMIEECPFCGTEIKPGAVVCRGCQAEKVQPGPGCFTFLFVLWLSLFLASLPTGILRALFDFGDGAMFVLLVLITIPTFRYTFRYVENALKKRGFRSPRWQRKQLT